MTGSPDAGSYWDGEMAHSAEAWYMRSFATLNIDSALAWAREAVECDSHHTLALAAVAYLSEKKGDVESVIAATETLIRNGYQVNAWLQYRATILLGTDRFEEALADCDRLVAGWPNDPGAYLLRARIERRAGRYADADRDLSFVIDNRGGTRYETAWLYFHRGTLRWLLDRDEAAAADYQKANEYLLYPTFATARLYILLRELGRTAQADDLIADMRRAHLDDPWLGDIFECLGGSLTPEGLAAIAESTGDPVTICEGYYYAAEASVLAHEPDEARKWFKMCLDTGVECDPENPLESQSEFELAQMRLSRIEGTDSAAAR
jgi:tetratricopeptide (TPR) repeat protein